MFRIQTTAALRVTAWIMFALVLGGCGSVEKVGDWWRGDREEAVVLAPGTVVYQCEGNKSFLARIDTSTQSAWVKFPDREFRLDPLPGAAAGRYTNGRANLNIKGDEAFLTEGTAVSYANCKRSNAG